MRVGVLAMQGAFREHIKSLNALGVEGVEIRYKDQLKEISGLIIPGGESTTISKLMIEYELFEPVSRLGREGMPIFGTCAGMVMLAKDIVNSQQPRLGLMDIKVKRNAFGRQVDSFEARLDIPAIGADPFNAVFIRAPYLEGVGPGVEVLASFGDKAVMARQNNLLVAAFHPELTDDIRIHKYFLSMID